MSATDAKPVLTTARLRLRQPRPDDAPRMAELASDFEITRMTARMPHPYKEADALAFIERVAHEDPSRDVHFVIDAEGEGLVGSLGFFTKDALGPEAGYWIGRPFWGRGYASEALEAGLRWSEDGWRKRLIIAGHFADNAASGRVLVKAGFLYTGVVDPLFSKARGEAAPSRMMIRLA